MPRFTESLESRSLFSASLSSAVTADLAKLASDVAGAKAQFQAYGVQLAADAATLKADVRAAGIPAHLLLLTTLNGTSTRLFAATKAGATRLLVLDGLFARRASADALLLAAHPGSALLQARAQSDLAAFNTASAIVEAQFGTAGAALGASAAAALDAVALAYAAQPAVTADIDTLKSDGSAFTTTLGDEIQSLQDDVTQLFTDVAGGA